jgi:hypothetical protein
VTDTQESSLQFNWQNFPNIGYIWTKVPEDILKHLRAEVDNIRNNFDNADKFNTNLVGHIKKEFALKDTWEIINTLACSMAEEYFKLYPQVKHNTNVLPADYLYEITCSQPWVNFQQKHEFNPIHRHNGVLSFVIWLDIPFNIEDELKMYPDMADGGNASACFAFHYLDILGNIATYHVPVGKSLSGTMCMFPAMLNHSVNPFYTSDEYRVSISANIHYK